MCEVVSDRAAHPVGLVPVRERHDPHVPGAVLDERGDRGRALTHHQVAFPMPDLGPLSHDGRTIPD
ncbi:MAG: hypothetical protein M3281_02700 [Chloroflexota bacterium]|nr:hypothetical protein [Chloroflexota bacterium]